LCSRSLDYPVPLTRNKGHARLTYVENYADQMRKARCRGMIRSYLKGRKKTTFRMIVAFMNPPNEKPLTRDTIANLLQQTLTEVRYPIAERLAILRRTLGVK